MVDVSSDALINRFLSGDTSILPMPAPYYLYTFKVLQGPYLTPRTIMAPLQPHTIGASGKGALPDHLVGLEVQVGEEEIDPFIPHLANHLLSREEIIHVLGAWNETNGTHAIALVSCEGVSEEERLELMEGYSFTPVITINSDGEKTDHIKATECFTSEGRLFTHGDTPDES
jgi:hypothetical protein